ncbi:MAG: peptidoglycan D,D-transpeptidase FtsI family protein [Candidatus Limnocylindrales bacterium]
MSGLRGGEPQRASGSPPTGGGSLQGGPLQGGPPRIAPALLRVGLALAVIYAGIGAGLAWWQVVEAERLTIDPANPLVAGAEQGGQRGSILDDRGVALVESVRQKDGTYRRSYPYPQVEPLVGYVSPQFGASGLEAAYAAQLLGVADASGDAGLLRKFRSQPFQAQDIRLSLDLRLQKAAMALLAGQRGAIVAIEPSTGRILALASSPSFDGDKVVDPKGGAAYFQSLLAKPADQSVLLDRATQGLYVPGSILKIVTSVAALGSGTITPQTTYPDQPGEEKTGFLVDGYRVVDGHHTFTGDLALDYSQAVEVSCNIYFAHVGLALGGDQLLRWGAQLGFGAPIPFDVPTAASSIDGGDGFIDDVELANAAYGQGEATATPLQMALVAATIANGGTLMRPHLVDAFVSADGSVSQVGSEVWRQVIDQATATIIEKAMRQAVEGTWGRRFAGAAEVPGVPTAGKSGTAQLGSGEPHSWFIGFAPATQPRIAVAVIIEHGGPSSLSAVPIGGEIMADWLAMAP